MVEERAAGHDLGEAGVGDQLAGSHVELGEGGAGLGYDGEVGVTEPGAARQVETGDH